MLFWIQVEITCSDLISAIPKRFFIFLYCMGILRGQQHFWQEFGYKIVAAYFTGGWNCIPRKAWIFFVKVLSLNVVSSTLYYCWGVNTTTIPANPQKSIFCIVNLIHQINDKNNKHSKILQTMLLNKQYDFLCRQNIQIYPKIDKTYRYTLK